LALRRKPRQLTAAQQRFVEELADLIREGRATLIGPIRQEILSGIRDKRIFNRLRKTLRAFEDVPLLAADFEEAASAHNTCRSAGVATTPIDLLICAVADRLSLTIFTTDADFQRYAQHLPIRLHEPRKK
jgi:predicted nucleic acid-binding protein